MAVKVRRRRRDRAGTLNGSRLTTAPALYGDALFGARISDSPRGGVSDEPLALSTNPAYTPGKRVLCELKVSRILSVVGGHSQLAERVPIGKNHVRYVSNPKPSSSTASLDKLKIASALILSYIYRGDMVESQTDCALQLLDELQAQIRLQRVTYGLPLLSWPEADSSSGSQLRVKWSIMRPGRPIVQTLCCVGRHSELCTPHCGQCIPRAKHSGARREAPRGDLLSHPTVC